MRMSRIDLRKYYLANVSEDEYYHRFYQMIYEINVIHNLFDGDKETDRHNFEVFDEEDAISQLRRLCQPGAEKDDSAEEEVRFLVLLFFLYKKGYYIKEFPNIIRRPGKCKFDFIYTDIRMYLKDRGDVNENGEVPYDSRRRLVASMHFVKNHTGAQLNESVDEVFARISTRSAAFEQLEEDEKLREIANVIENLLKDDKGFKTLQYEKYCDKLVTDESVKSFRKIIQCYRHASEDSLRERSQISGVKKAFLIDYGITILNVIYALCHEENE